MPASASAYLIVTRFDVLYTRFADDPKFDSDLYACPLHGTTPDFRTVRYRGLDRDPLTPWIQDLNGVVESPAMAAEMRMARLEDAGKCDQASVYASADVEDVLRLAEEESPAEFEAVWARVVGSADVPPSSWERLGFEPSYFPAGWFSPIADCMCFPRWHGTDPEGIAFAQYFAQLNSHGLFDTADLARDFLGHYLSFEWTERGDYEVIEVFGRPSPRIPEQAPR